MSAYKEPIYLDYHATTPVAPEVLEAMLPWFTRQFGNPASRSHVYGWKASEAVEMAREQVSDLIRVDSKDLVFVSGATEGLNFAIKGLADAMQPIGRHIVAMATEHHAVLDPLAWLERKGFEVTLLPVSSEGLIDPDRLKNALRKDTIMVIAMLANNETGVINDIRSVGELCTHEGIPLVCDATQAVGKIPVVPGELGAAVVVFSAHKLYGPKGTGAVFLDPVRLRVKPMPLIHGGGHERGYRSGTLNVPAIVGFGLAAHLRKTRMHTEAERISTLRDQFERIIMEGLEKVSVNGAVHSRLPTVSNLLIRYADSQAVMTRFRTKLAISSGSACSSANPEPSHVLLAMGLSSADAKSSYRISLGAPTTTEEIKEAAFLLMEAVREERAVNPVWQMLQQGIDLDEVS